jgi:hypothetical protein
MQSLLTGILSHIDIDDCDNIPKQTPVHLIILLRLAIFLELFALWPAHRRQILVESRDDQWLSLLWLVRELYVMLRIQKK